MEKFFFVVLKIKLMELLKLFSLIIDSYYKVEGNFKS